MLSGYRSFCALLMAPTIGLLPTVQAAERPCPLADPTSLSAAIPGDFHSDCQKAARNLANLQHDFDVYSWESFVALNWPALQDGNADLSTMIGGPTPHGVVWESYASAGDVFLRDGAKPEPWVHEKALPVAVKDEGAEQLMTLSGQPTGRTLRQALINDDDKFLSKLAKGHSWMQAAEQPFNTGPLIDQNGRYARFEILMNRDMFEYIVTNELYSAEGQKRFSGHAVFPCGSLKGEWVSDLDFKPEFAADGRTQAASVGAIVIKAAWKVLDEAEIASGRFYSRPTVLWTPRDPKHSIEHEAVQEATMGLVGMHIVHKSADVPQWNWSTFEHVDNVPEVGAAIGDRKFSFFAPGEGGLEYNTAPSRPWDPTNPEPEPPARRSRIVRQIAISDDVKKLNAVYQAQLRAANPKSVWQYYQLISTQWPTRPARAKPGTPGECDVPALAPGDVLGGPAPIFLGNATLESYIQGQVPNTSSSCMDCHANATDHEGRFSDFTFLLERAK